MAASSVKRAGSDRRVARLIARRHAEMAELIDAVGLPADLDQLLLDLSDELRTVAERRCALRDEPGEPAAEPADEWLTIAQVAQLTGRAVSTIKHGPKDAIPGRRQLVPYGAVRWSKRAILHWIEGLSVHSSRAPAGFARSS